MATAQVTLTDIEADRLRALCERTGKSEDQLLHEAVGALLADATKNNRLEALKQARGVWEGRTDLPDFAAVRAGMDRM